MSRPPSWFAAKRGRRDANQAPIVKALKALQYFVVDCASCGNGTLDLLVYDRLANPHWCELKTPKGKLNAAQLAFIAQLERRGISWGCCRTLDEVLALVGDRRRLRTRRQVAAVCGACSACTSGGDKPPHDADCPAFTPDGSVK